MDGGWGDGDATNAGEGEGFDAAEEETSPSLPASIIPQARAHRLGYAAGNKAHHRICLEIEAPNPPSLCQLTGRLGIPVKLNFCPDRAG